MPSINWNRSWAKNLAHHINGGLKGRFYGDQWGVPESSPELREIVDRFVRPYAAGTCLEIGSGGGRWTQYLQDAELLYLVELNPEMFSYIIDRFENPDHFQYITTHGSDIPLVPRKSVDFAFTFGTFVHMDVSIIAGYTKSLAQLMKPGGTFCLQFSDKRKQAAADNPDFADNNPEIMTATLTANGFRVIECDESLNHSAVIRAEATG